MNAWCLLAAAVILADGLSNYADLIIALTGILAALLVPPILALIIAALIWFRVSYERPLMPLVAAGTLALCLIL